MAIGWSLPLELDADARAIETALADRMDLRCCCHPVAFEVVYEQPREAWWAIEASVRQRSAHLVQMERVVQLLGLIRTEPGGAAR